MDLTYGAVVFFVTISLPFKGVGCNLYDEIFQGYHKQQMPNWDKPGEPLNVTIHAIPGALVNFAEIEEKITLTTTIYIQWTDNRLTWDVQLYNNIYGQFITTDDIWMPYLYLSNAVNEIKPIGQNSAYYTFVLFNGSVSWTPGEIFEAQCKPNVRRFPFDTQECMFMFVMWGLYPGVVNFRVPSSEPNMDYFFPNSDWDIVDMKQGIDESIPTYYLVLTIKRQSLYYVITVILPTLFFALLNPLVFCLPVESGERISLGVTILLAYTIFLTIVSTSIPAKSNPYSMLILVLVVIMLVSGVIVIFIIINAHFYYKEETDDVSLCLKWLADKFKKKKRNVIVKNCEDKDGSALIQVTGKDISHALDIVFCTISVVFYIGMLAAYLIFILVTE